VNETMQMTASTIHSVLMLRMTISLLRPGSLV
jgi:hypothetical protein